MQVNVSSHLQEKIRETPYFTAVWNLDDELVDIIPIDEQRYKKIVEKDVDKVYSHGVYTIFE